MRLSCLILLRFFVPYKKWLHGSFFFLKRNHYYVNKRTKIPFDICRLPTVQTKKQHRGKKWNERIWREKKRVRKKNNRQTSTKSNQINSRVRIRFYSTASRLTISGWISKKSRSWLYLYIRKTLYAHSRNKQQYNQIHSIGTDSLLSISVADIFITYHDFIVC